MTNGTNGTNDAPVGRFQLVPRGPYSLAASIRFLKSFPPAAYRGAGDDEHLHLAFVADGGERVAGVCVQSRDGVIHGEVFGAANPDTVRRQTARILSLDVDGSAFSAVGERDAIVGRLQSRFPGLRPVCFFSPYEAAAWAIIGNRIRIVQAARIKDRIAQELGPAVTVHGEALHAFPAPSVLAEMETFPGLSERKIAFLRALAAAAQDNRGPLDADRLRDIPFDAALTALKTLPGIGDFGAELILLRGAGEPDALPTREPRLAYAVALAYNLPTPPDPSALAALADAWRPYRTWVAFLLRAMLEEETRETRGAHRPEAQVS